MAFLATVLFLIGLGLVGSRFFKHDAAIAEQETRSRFIDLVRQDVGSDELADADKKEAKKNSKPHTVVRLAQFLAGTELLSTGEGFMLMERLNRELILAGIRDRYTPYEAMAQTFVIWVVGLGLPFMCLLAGMSKILCVLIMFFAIYYPFGKLKALKKNRKDAIQMELPIFIQQLAMILGSSMITIDEAIRRVAKNAQLDPYDSILAREFGRAHTEYTLVGHDREQAFRDIVDRTDSVGVMNLVEAIIQGLRTGTAMDRVLEEYGTQAREIWRQDARTFKAQKEPLVTMGMVITMFGGFILIAGPMAINLMKTINGL